MARKKRTTPEQFEKAIEGSGGDRQLIAKKLKITYYSTTVILSTREGPEWDRVRLKYEKERERVLDLAERRIKELVEQKKDLGESGRNARWVLERRRSDIYGERKQVTVEGGEHALKVESKNQIDVDHLPLEVKRALLQAIEEKENPVENGKKEILKAVQGNTDLPKKVKVKK